MPNLELTEENYYSQEANKDYMSVSQFKDFAGTIGHMACEETALKKFKGIIPQIKTTPLLVGSYIDSYFEGTLDKFKEDNCYDICTKTSIKAFEKSENPADLQLLADYRQAETIINRINNDQLFSQFMSGQKQVIMTGNLFGTEWKIKMDSYHPDDKIVDLKVMRDMKPIWSDVTHSRMDFIRYWGYDIQGAVYQKIVEINTGKKLPFYLAVATKETPSDIEIIEITQPYLDEALKFVEENLPHVLALKSENIKPNRCGICYFCKDSKQLTMPITIEDIMPIQYGSATDNDDDVPEHGYSLFDD